MVLLPDTSLDHALYKIEGLLRDVAANLKENGVRVIAARSVDGGFLVHGSRGGADFEQWYSSDARAPL